MPQPSPNDVHVDRPLTNISVAYMQSRRDFVCDRLFPMVPVGKQGDLYYRYDKSFFFRDEAKLRAPATESAGGGYGVTTDSYYCPVYAFHKDVDPQTRANHDTPLDADRDATRFVTGRLLLKREKLFLSEYFKTGLWTGSTTGADITPGTLWSASGSTPIEDIEAEIWGVHEKTGEFPNKLLLGKDVYKTLRNHSTVLERIKYTERGRVTPQLLAALLAPPDVDDFEVLVAKAIENTAKEGAADSMAYIANPKDALLVHAAPSPGLMTPSAGYIFGWSGLLGSGVTGSRIVRIPMDWLGIGTERVECELALDMKVVAADMGVYFDGAVA